MQQHLSNGPQMQRGKAKVRRTRRDIVRILDRSALAQWLQSILDEDHNGVLTEAAGAGEIGIYLLSKLLNERQNGLTLTTLGQLYALGGSEARIARLEECLSTPGSRALEEAQGEWEIREWERLRGAPEGLDLFDVSASTRRLLGSGHETEGQLRKLFIAEGRVMMEHLSALPKAKASLEKFVARAQELSPQVGGHLPDKNPADVWALFSTRYGPPGSLSSRAAVAALRVLEPLMRACVSPLELSWREMNAETIVAYLEAATRAELIMLRRAPDHERARSLDDGA